MFTLLISLFAAAGILLIALQDYRNTSYKLLPTPQP